MSVVVQNTMLSGISCCCDSLDPPFEERCPTIDKSYSSSERWKSSSLHLLCVVYLCDSLSAARVTDVLLLWQLWPKKGGNRRRRADRLICLVWCWDGRDHLRDVLLRRLLRFLHRTLCNVRLPNDKFSFKWILSTFQEMCFMQSYRELQ